MWSQPHSHGVYPAPPPSTWVLLAPAPDFSAGRHVSTSGPPTAGGSNDRPQTVAMDFDIPVRLSYVHELADNVAQRLTEMSATGTATEPASAVIPVASTKNDAGLADFRSSSARVALAGVSCALLLLLLVSTVTRRWQLQRIAVHERARAARRERRRTRDAVESAGTRRTHDLVIKDSETEQEDLVQQRTVPGGSASNEKGTSTDTAMLLPGMCTATTEPLHIPGRGGEETDDGRRREEATVREGDIRSSRRVSLVDWNTGEAGRETHKLLRRQHAGEEKVLPTSSATAPHKVVLPVVNRPVHDRLRQRRIGPRSNDDYELTVSEEEALDIGDKTHSAETSTSSHRMYLPHGSYYRTQPAAVGKMHRRRGIINKLRRENALTSSQPLRQMMPRRRFQQELISAATEGSSLAAIDPETEIADLEATEAAVGSSPRKMRRTKEQRKIRKCYGRNRRRRHRRRGRFYRHGRSAAREGTWSDGEYEGERSFVGGVLRKLLMMSALPAFTR